ncbi:MAG: FAD binding domain-containing protein [Anaerolineales bacterium]|nr:FAD binding domain-containing protein [Anaerolineales bacterium]
MATWENYHLAHSVPDALQALSAAAGETCIIAGGTDLLLDLQQGRHAPVTTLVDVTHIPEMRSLEIRQGRLYIGAALPLNKLAAHPLVFEHARALNEAASLIGGPQVRNTATLGGNVAHALPAADGTIALMALDAQAEIADLEGRRLVPLGELFLGPGRSALLPRQELLVGFYLPLSEAGQASAFRRVMRPQGVAIAILNLALWLARQDEHIVDICIAVGPSGPTPRRALETEEVLRAEQPSEATLKRAIEALLAESHFRTSPHRATADYRRHMAGVLLRETLSAAWERARG